MKNLIPIIILTFLVSCGARKVSKSNIDESFESNSKVDKNLNLEKNDSTVSSTKTVDLSQLNSRQNTVFLEPINENNPIELVNSKGEKTTVKNAKIKFESKETNEKKNFEKNTNIFSKSKIKKKETLNTDSKTNINSKRGEFNSNRKPPFFSFWFWFWLILLFLGLIFWFRKKIPIIKNFF